jgi:hypothetical protein
MSLTNILGARPRPTPRPRVHYIPQLTKEYKAICSSVNGGIYWIFIYKLCFGCLPEWGTSKTGVTGYTCTYNNNT